LADAAVAVRSGSKRSSTSPPQHPQPPLLAALSTDAYARALLLNSNLLPAARATAAELRSQPEGVQEARRSILARLFGCALRC
jgi:hypothetical protein